VIAKGLRYLRSNALGALALFVALGGTGYAASGGFTSNGKLQGCVGESGGLTLLKAGKHCKRGQKTVAWNQTGPAGAKGAPGAASTPGTSGPAGAPGKDGAPGTALAYGTFEARGALEPETHSKALATANVDHVATGVYCFKSLSFAPNTAMVAPNNAFAANMTIVSVLVSTKVNSPCNEGEFVRVRTALSTTGALTDEPFNIWFN
jgi:hypothetical protein